MNTRSIPERNGDSMITAPSFSTKEQDLVELVKTPAPRLALLGKTSPVNFRPKVTEKTGDDQKKRRKKRKKKWTKPEGKPKRPLSAYNIFFAQERILMLGKDMPTAEQEALKKKVHCKTHGKISFAVMARTIGAKWKALGANDKKIYEDRAREEKARYLTELTAWKEAQKNGISTRGSDIGKLVDDDISIAASQGLGIAHGKPGLVSISTQAQSLPDLPGVEHATSLPRGNNGHNSNLLRLLLEEENRSRYLSLLRLQSQANQNVFPQMDQTAMSLNGVPRRVSNPMESLSGSQPLQQRFDPLFGDRALLRNIQATPNPSMPEYNSRYFQALEEYKTMLQLEEQHNRMVGSFNGGRNTGGS
jgi:hypothetical protein